MMYNKSSEVMQIMKHTRILTMLLAAMLTLCPPAASAADALPALTDHGLDVASHSVHYPQLTGLADSTLEERLNARLLALGQIEAQIARLPLLLSSPTPLTVDYTAFMAGDVFSCALSLKGPVEDLRPTHVRAAMNVDLTTGEDITLDMLFTQPDRAVAAMEAMLEQEVLPALSAHLRASELLPLPDTFTLSAQGLTLYYPIDRLCTLSDLAGAVTFTWGELREWLDLSEGSVLRRIGAYDTVTLQSGSAQSIAACVEEGRLPGIPAALSDSVQALTDRYHMLTDPDLYEGGRMFALEDAAFRGVWLLTDALTRSWDQSTVQGIRCDRVSFYGLLSGHTTIEAWREALGEPDATVQVDTERAQSWRIVPGTSDYYVFGEHRLRLHADEDGVLTTLFLTR